MGNISIRLSTGEIQHISHVLYSPGITKNLISVGFLADRGFILEFQKNECLIKNLDGILMASALRNVENGLYKLQGEIVLECYEVNSSECEAFTITSHDQFQKASLWHKRLDHYQYQGMRHMLQFGAVRELPKMSIKMFHVPPVCKASKVENPFRRSSQQKAQKFCSLFIPMLLGHFE